MVEILGAEVWVVVVVDILSADRAMYWGVFLMMRGSGTMLLRSECVMVIAFLISRRMRKTAAEEEHETFEYKELGIYILRLYVTQLSQFKHEILRHSLDMPPS